MDGPGWRAWVEDTIERLARRAAQGEQFARLALPGWYAELARIKEVEATHDATHDVHDFYNVTGAAS